MKRSLLNFLILLGLSTCLQSQVNSFGSNDFKEIQQSFYQQFTPLNTDTSESSSYRQFKRWENFWGPRLTPHNNIDQALKKQKEFIDAYDPKNRISGSVKSNWVELGPKENDIGGTGRIDAIAFHPTDTNTMFVGCPSGGVWASYNAGNNWQNLNTDFQLPFLGVSTIAIDPLDPDNIFIGSGDVDSEWTYSTGIYRSKDAGQTWEQAGLNWLSMHFTIGKILLDPNDNNVAFAATSLGIYKTESRNAQNPSWMKVYPSVAEDFEYIRNMTFLPSQANVLYATGMDIISSSENGSLNSWNRIATAQNGLDFTNTPWPDTFNGEEYIQSLNLTIAPQGDYLYVNCIGRDTPPPYNWQSATHFHFFSYDIANDIWITIPTTGLFGGPVGSGISVGRTEMVVSPQNSKMLYCAGVRLYSYNLELPDQPWKHVFFNAHIDFHELTFSPWEENTLFAGTDGGLFKKDLSDPQAIIDGGSNVEWISTQREFYGTFNGNPTLELNNGLGISTIYNFGSSAIDPYQMMIGCQDCGLFYHKNNQWNTIINNADGFQCLMDKTDINLIYATLVHPTNGSIFKSNENCLNPSWEIMMSGNSPVNESSWFGAALIADPTNTKTLFQARLNLWKVDDASTANILDWYKITEIDNLIPSGWGNSTCAIWALEIGPSNPEFLYFTSVKLSNWVTDFDAVRLFKTSSGGGLDPDDWTDITPPTPGNTEGTFFISDIAVSSNNSNHIWVSYSGYLSDYKVKYFDGTNWSDYNTGLPNIPINCIEYTKGSNEAIFVGTDAGVYYRDASMTQWEPFMENLPAVIVNCLEINYSNQKLRAGTFGRGLWETDLPGGTSAIKGSANKLANLNASRMLIFPNPNPGSFTFTIPDDIKISALTLSDLFGRKVEISMTQTSKSQLYIELDKKQAGIYFLQIKTPDGAVTKKILVE